jgi:hypothetical protein
MNITNIRMRCRVAFLVLVQSVQEFAQNFIGFQLFQVAAAEAAYLLTLDLIIIWAEARTLKTSECVPSLIALAFAVRMFKMFMDSHKLLSVSNFSRWRQ